MNVVACPQPNLPRLQAFWNREETDRPLLATGVGSFTFTELFPIGLSRLKEGELHPEDVVFEYFREDYENLRRNHAQVAADVPWSVFPLVVLPWAEAVAGCHLIHREGNIWAEPWLESREALAAADLRPRQEWLQRLGEFTDWLVAWADGRCPVAVSLLRGPADLLAAVRGADRSILDLVDEPAPVDRALDALTDVWLAAARTQASRIPAFAGGYGWNIQNLWSAEPGGWFQDDAIAFWSPSLYRDHALTREARLARWAPRTGCHLHSAAIFTVDGLLRLPELGVIEMNLDISGLTLPEMIPAFRRILARQRLYVWGHFSREDLALMRANLPTRGLALQLMAETPAQVSQMLVWARELWGA
jgi:hypothetical protein